MHACLKRSAYIGIVAIAAALAFSMSKPKIQEAELASLGRALEDIGTFGESARERDENARKGQERIAVDVATRSQGEKDVLVSQIVEYLRSKDREIDNYKVNWEQTDPVAQFISVVENEAMKIEGTKKLVNKEKALATDSREQVRRVMLGVVDIFENSSDPDKTKRDLELTLQEIGILVNQSDLEMKEYISRALSLLDLVDVSTIIAQSSVIRSALFQISTRNKLNQNLAIRERATKIKQCISADGYCKGYLRGIYKLVNGPSYFSNGTGAYCQVPYKVKDALIFNPEKDPKELLFGQRYDGICTSVVREGNFVFYSNGDRGYCQLAQTNQPIPHLSRRSAAEFFRQTNIGDPRTGVCQSPVNVFKMTFSHLLSGPIAKSEERRICNAGGSSCEPFPSKTRFSVRLIDGPSYQFLEDDSYCQFPAIDKSFRAIEPVSIYGSPFAAQFRGICTGPVKVANVAYYVNQAGGYCRLMHDFPTAPKLSFRAAGEFHRDFKNNDHGMCARVINYQGLSYRFKSWGPFCQLPTYDPGASHASESDWAAALEIPYIGLCEGEYSYLGVTYNVYLGDTGPEYCSTGTFKPNAPNTSNRTWAMIQKRNYRGICWGSTVRLDGCSVALRDYRENAGRGSINFRGLVLDCRSNESPRGAGGKPIDRSQLLAMSPSASRDFLALPCRAIGSQGRPTNDCRSFQTKLQQLGQ